MCVAHMHPLNSASISAFASRLCRTRYSLNFLSLPHCASLLSGPWGAQISNGSLIEINETGTRMRLVPGLLVGGSHLEHECHASRSIGYYLEALASLAPFAKHATEITLRGVTNDDRDPSVCALVVCCQLLSSLPMLGLGSGKNILKLR
jgi:hypothetical protein